MGICTKEKIVSKLRIPDGDGIAKGNEDEEIGGGSSNIGAGSGDINNEGWDG